MRRVRRLTPLVGAMVLIVGGCTASPSLGPAEAAASNEPSPPSVAEGTALSSMDVAGSGKARAKASRVAQLQLLACLEDKGFPGTMNPDGSFTTGVNPEQRGAYDAAWRECEQQLDYGVADDPFTDAELRWLYDQNVAAYECLKEQGYDPPEPVSYDVYAYDMDAGTPPWSPFLPDNRPGGLPKNVCKEPDLYSFATESP